MGRVNVVYDDTIVKKKAKFPRTRRNIETLEKEREDKLNEIRMKKQAEIDAIEAEKEAERKRLENEALELGVELPLTFDERAKKEAKEQLDQVNKIEAEELSLKKKKIRMIKKEEKFKQIVDYDPKELKNPHVPLSIPISRIALKEKKKEISEILDIDNLEEAAKKISKNYLKKNPNDKEGNKNQFDPSILDYNKIKEIKEKNRKATLTKNDQTFNSILKKFEETVSDTFNPAEKPKIESFDSFIKKNFKLTTSGDLIVDNQKEEFNKNYNQFTSNIDRKDERKSFKSFKINEVEKEKQKTEELKTLKEKSKN